MASLRELQGAFAAALRDPKVTCAVSPPANLAVYRNNAAITFRETLEGAFPVVLRRVGSDYFRQLAHHYRAHFPSRSGDLHWIGRDFASFLDTHLAGGDYAWLADLARLEWAREEASVAIELRATGADSLARFAPEKLEHLTFTLQPSLRLVASPFPIVRVWMANQAQIAPPVDQSNGEEAALVQIRAESVEVQQIAPDAFRFISALQRGATLGAAMSTANVDGPRLAELLGFLFASALVCGVGEGGPEPVDGQRVGTSS